MRVAPLARAIGLSLLVATSASADLKDDIRYTLLSAELGVQLPTGAGVRVGQIEVVSSGNYLPSLSPPTLAEFAGKSFFAQSGPSDVSGHAEGVGRWFYGSTTSIAPGITEIEAYEVNSWLLNYVNVLSDPAVPPAAPAARVFSHSWVGDGATRAIEIEILQRIDYLIEAHDVVHVVGVNNGSTHAPLLSHAMNVISVGRSDGNHPVGTIDLDDPDGVYVVGRNSPDLVAPRPTTSHATPVVAGAAAMLIEAATENPGWSNGSYVAGGETIHHAAASEVIKAALMAGARREVLAGYTINTQNGLSNVYGAGQLDIYNSYHILAAGEQDGASPLDAAVMIGAYGFDFQPSFAHDDVAWYHFELVTDLAVTLAWNVHIAAGDGDFDPAPTLVNLDLHLYRLDGSDVSLVASSTSGIDNTESLWITDLDPTATYRLEVVRDDELGPHDYGLAWRMTVVPEPSTLVLGILGGAGLLAVGRLRRRQRLSGAS